MPDSPATIRYLTTRERQIVVHSIKSNKSGIHDKKFKKNQLIEAVKDFRLYLFFVAICAANIANGGVSNFGSEIISQFGYDSKTTSLLGMAPGAMEVVAVYFGAWLSHVTHTRVIPGVLMYILAIVGGVMMIAIPSTSSSGRYSGYVICFTYPVASPFIYSFLSSSVSGTTKRIVFNMVLQVGYSVGNLIGPQTYRVKDAPGYVPAKITLVVVFGVAAACLVGIGGVHARWNRRNGLGGWKDVVSAGEDGMEGEEEGKREVDDGEDLSDLTDKQRSKFRYPY
ncbi:related to DAL5 - Allantoate and ureidosuccinate permease [Ustilago bromivora]|uniref:Related to DAL5 - Allantoate and ureidosuccinate permease n=2 Tax=Ustilago bromivora TaxID=307758 RepID=A0A8H8QNW1_9BASI|nr:related to DAL5 - Allantoate and ureidosuccinate permease [Ustilago bromivora]